MWKWNIRKIRAEEVETLEVDHWRDRWKGGGDFQRVMEEEILGVEEMTG